MTPRPTQSRAASLAEATSNVVLGYGLGLVVQRIAYPLFGIVTSVGTDATPALLFSLTSLMRAFLPRRLFAHLGG